MNKVKSRCEKDKCAKFYNASKKMFGEVKALKLVLYFLALVTVVLSSIPGVSSILIGKVELSFIFTMASFGITIITEVLSSFLTNHKERAILLSQLYEAEITGSTFSKIEYDREMTNALNELAIRKGLPQIRKSEKRHIVEVPDEITDDYSYLYLARKSAANTNYLLDKMFVIYCLVFALIVASLFVVVVFNADMTAGFVMKLIIGFYPVIIPIIRNIFACKKCQTNCVKICADIDNFFADGDSSLERLARFYFYVQNVEFEMLQSRPAMYSIFPMMFKRGSRILDDGVTLRFKEAVYELKARSTGIMAPVSGKKLITHDDDGYEELLKKEREAEEKRLASERRAVEREKKLLEAKKAEIEVARAADLKKLEEEKAKNEALKKELAKKSSTTKAPVKKTTTSKTSSSTKAQTKTQATPKTTKTTQTKKTTKTTKATK